MIKDYDNFGKFWHSPLANARSDPYRFGQHVIYALAFALALWDIASFGRNVLYAGDVKSKEDKKNT